MAFVPYNPNPYGKRTGDCAVRAVAKATNQPWENAYTALSVEGYKRGDLPNANHVLGAYLKSKGFKRFLIPDTCPDCYTVEDFANDHPKGMYVLLLENHVVTVHDGDFFDTWDSSREPVDSFWAKEGSF